MEPPDNDDSTSLLGDALQRLMVAEDEQPEEPIQVEDTMEFHRYMDLPSHIREDILGEALEQEVVPGTNERIDWCCPLVTNHNVARLAAVSKEWQQYVEGYLFELIRIDPSVEEDVLRFKELFKHHRRKYLRVVDIIIDDRPTGPWHMTSGMLQISLAMEKVGKFFNYLNSSESHEDEDLDSCDSDDNEDLDSSDSRDSSDSSDSSEPGDLDSRETESIITSDFGEDEPFKINFVSLNLEFPEVKFAPFGEPSIQTSSLWTGSQLNLLTNSNLSTDMPLRAIWSACPKRFGIAGHLTFPLDCVPLPATIAIMQTMPNLESCSFELSLKRSSEEGMARLTDFVQQLPTLLPSLSELSIRATDMDSDPGPVPPSAHRLSAALRDNSENLKTLKVQGIFMQQNFFDSFGVDRDLMLAKVEWNWPNLEELDLDFLTFGPSPGPFSKPNQLSLTPAELLIAAGRATMAMPALRMLRISIFDDSEDDPASAFFSIKKELPQRQERSGNCCVKMSGFSRVQEQWILEAWIPFLKYKARLVSEGSIPSDSDDDSFVDVENMRVYQTFPEDHGTSTTFGAGALVNNASFLEAQRLVQAKSGMLSVPNIR